MAKKHVEPELSEAQKNFNKVQEKIEEILKRYDYKESDIPLQISHPDFVYWDLKNQRAKLRREL